MRGQDKFLGALIGGAAGDALGYPVEFDSANEILAEYGDAGVTQYKLRGGIAQISDDTQMTLFTAAGLLTGLTREMHRGFLADPSDYIIYGYRDWYRTQTTPFSMREGERYSWLSNVKQLYNRRAPGMTCLSALQEGVAGTIEHPVNDSKGCGGIMRVAPVGLFYCDSKRSYAYSDLVAARAAALTHGHELGYIPAAALAHILRRIVEQGDGVEAATHSAMQFLPTLFPTSKYLPALQELIERAVALAKVGEDDRAAIFRLGQGFVAEETLAIALYCAIKYEDDFARGIAAAVSHGGDSDSTGAVAGNILGARRGYAAIPERFTARLELKDVIGEIARDLYRCGVMRDADFGERIWTRKYVTFDYCPEEDT